MSNAFEISPRLTKRQKQSLEILAKAERPLQNKDFHERFETNGRRTTLWAKALGPCTKARNHDPASLWARGLVTVVTVAKDKRAYILTELGREFAKALGFKLAADPSRAVDIATGSERPKQSFRPTPLVEDPHNKSSPPKTRVVGTLEGDTLSQRARDAVACSYCFMSDRAREWGKVPRRPADRPDDVAFPIWIGQHYRSSNPRVAVMMLNPGHKSAEHKLKRRDLGHQFRDGELTYDEYNSKLTPLVSQWGFGRVVKWLRAIELEPEAIAFLNVALCAVADDKYFPKLFDTCFERHTRGLLATLEPDVVLLCGKKELAPFKSSIEALGTQVILTWHYRGMYTNRGKGELERVRNELDRLRC